MLEKAPDNAPASPIHGFSHKGRDLLTIEQATIRALRDGRPDVANYVLLGSMVHNSELVDYAAVLDLPRVLIEAAVDHWNKARLSVSEQLAQLQKKIESLDL